MPSEQGTLPPLSPGFPSSTNKIVCRLNREPSPRCCQGSRLPPKKPLAHNKRVDKGLKASTGMPSLVPAEGSLTLGRSSPLLPLGFPSSSNKKPPC